MKIRYAPLAVACALMVAASAQAAAVTHYFGGKLDTVVDLPSLTVGNSFTGSFMFESTAVDVYSNPALDSIIGVYNTGSVIEATVNGHAYSTCGTCASITVEDNFFSSGDYFFASSGGPPSVTGPSLDGFAPFVVFVSLSDSSGMAFNSDALPSNLALSSFDSSSFEIRFGDNSGGPHALGSLTYLSTSAPPVPEASTSAMLALGLGALALMRRRKSH